MLLRFLQQRQELVHADAVQEEAEALAGNALLLPDGQGALQNGEKLLLVIHPGQGGGL